MIAFCHHFVRAAARAEELAQDARARPQDARARPCRRPAAAHAPYAAPAAVLASMPQAAFSSCPPE